MSKVKRILTFMTGMVVALAVMLLGSGTARAAAFAGGDGSPEGVGEGSYQIATPAQLNMVRDDLSAHYKLIADIDLTDYLSVGGDGYNGGAGWLPIGGGAPGYGSGDPFTGAFDGGGHTITGLYINRPGDSYVGLFGYVVGSASIKDVRLLNVDVTGYCYIGGLEGGSQSMGYGYPSITDCYVTGVVKGGDDYSTDAGGLVGDNHGSITGCHAAVTVTANYDYAMICCDCR